MNSITISLDYDKSSDTLKNGYLCQTKVCGDNIQGIDCGDNVADWLSIALGISGLRLIRQNNNEDRISRHSQNNIALANVSQYLLINSTSVHWLSEKVDDWIVEGIFPEKELESVIDRFRGNLIIATGSPLDESKWKSIQIGNVSFKV